MSFYKPTKVLAMTTISTEPLEAWPYDEGDEFWSGGQTPKPYRWKHTCSVTYKAHSSPMTITPFQYNGLDVNVGDWVGDNTGRALKIVSIESKTESEVVMVLEDVERYNAINDVTVNGDGSLKTTQLFCFELDDEWLPNLDGIPISITAPNVIGFLYGRFQRFNPENDYLFKKMNHGFTENDVIVISPYSGELVKYTESSSTYPLLGAVSLALENRFYIRPINKILDDISPSLPASKGNYVYSDNNGNLTASPTGKRVYLQLSDPDKSIIDGTVANPSITSGSILELNGVNITSPSTLLSDLVNTINTTNQSVHNVSASEVQGANSVTSTTGDLAYGIVGALLPMAGEINGVTINFSTTDSGSSTLGDPNGCDAVDMAVDINNANIPNITASAESNRLTITNSTGGAITLANVQADGFGTNFAGPSSCTGIPFSTAAVTDSKIRLERLDGGAIVVKNVTGSLTNQLGIYSVENGKRPTGMIVENWDRTSNMYVVETISDRDLIEVVFNGDEAFVNDSGNGEWSKWLYDGFQWKLTATEDSARTDADVLSMIITYTDVGSTTIGTVSSNSRVTDVTVEVTEAFDDINSTLNIGDVDVNDRLMSEDIIDLTELGTYTFTPSHVYNTGSDTDLNAYLNPASSTQGSLKVIISYS